MPWRRPPRTACAAWWGGSFSKFDSLRSRTPAAPPLFPPRVALVGAHGAGSGERAGDQVPLDRVIGAGAVDRRLHVAGALDREQAGGAERALDGLCALVGRRRVEAAVDQQQRGGRLAVERAGVAIGVVSGPGRAGL